MDDFDKLSDQVFTSINGFITDYFAEVMRELRKTSYADAHEKYFRLGNQLNQRDTIAVKKTISGMIKLLYSHGEYTSAVDLETVPPELVGTFNLIFYKSAEDALFKALGVE